MGQDGYVSSVDRFENLQSFGHNSLFIQPKLMKFGQSESYEILELFQLDLSQSEVHSPRYKIMKVTRSAGFTDSDSSNVSIIALGIYILDMAEFSEEIQLWNLRTNPTDFMTIGVL
jgi:hypothetical protein